MKIPSSVIIFGAECKIVEVHPCVDEYGNLCDGLFDANSMRIELEKKTSMKNKEHTLIHELGHAMFYRMSLGQTRIDPQIEEIIVNSNATMIQELFNIRFKKV